MTRSAQLLGAVSAFALVAMSSAPAIAAGTTAGDTITNNVTVTFEVGGVEQTEVTDSDTFTVDRKIDVLVNFTGTSNTQVAPGSDNGVLAFDVQNLSNAVVDLDLAAALTGGTGDGNDIGLRDDGTGAFTSGSFQIFLDSDGDGQLSAAELAAGPITVLDDMAEDEIRKVLVVADFAIDALNDETFNVTLTATALNADGSAIVASTDADANTDGVDTVFADGEGDTDALEDGAFSDTGIYEVAGALLSVVKSSRIVSDPVNGTVNPKAIPGAVIEYCIAVTNGADAADATNVVVSDELPADVTFTPSDFGIFVNGTATVDTSGPTPVASCTVGSGSNAEGTADATFTDGGGVNADEIEANLLDIPAATTRSVYFRVTID